MASEPCDVLEIDTDGYLSDIDGPLPTVRSKVVKIVNVTTGSTEQSVESAVAARDRLFPKPPHKLPELTDIDIFSRRPSARGQHSSIRSRHSKPSNTVTSQSFSVREPKQPLIQRSKINEAITKAKLRVQTNSASARTVKFIANPPETKPIQRSCDAQTQTGRSVFSRLTQDAHTQTDKCKCQLKTQTKNKNRRLRAKRDRETVRTLNQSA